MAMLLGRLCHTKQAVLSGKVRLLQSGRSPLYSVSTGGLATSVWVSQSQTERANLAWATQRRYRHGASSSDLNEAEKRLNEILRKVKQRPNANASVKNEKRGDTSETTSIDSLYDRFTAEADVQDVSGEKKRFSGAKSTFEQLESREAGSSLFDRLTSNATPSQSRPTAGSVAPGSSTSLFDRLIMEQTVKTESKNDHHRSQAASKAKGTAMEGGAAAKSRTVPSVVDSVLTQMVDGPALAVFTTAAEASDKPQEVASDAKASVPASDVSEQGALAQQSSVRRGKLSATIYNNEVLNAIEREHLDSMVSTLPFNAFEEQIAWTRNGRLWPYPVDNEYRYEEAQVHFREHAFLDRYLNQLGFPKAGPIRRYAELVCVALANNAHLTARQKRAHLEWLRFYFADRLKVLSRFGRDDEEAAASESPAAAVAAAQSRIDEARARSDALGSLLAKAERAAVRSDADTQRSSQLRTEKRQRKDIIQATRTAQRVLHKAETPAISGGAAATAAAAGAKKADAKKK